MANPNDTELLPPSGAITRGPALGSPELSTEYLARIKENLEVLLGRRGGSGWDRAVTFRDLHGMGLSGGAGGGMVFNMAGAESIDPTSPGFQQFIGRLSSEILNSAAFKLLRTRIGSEESNAHLPDEIKRQLRLSLEQVARDRQSAIETVEDKIQTTVLSMASSLREITASLERTAAGVREFDVAYADRTQAIALKVTQLAASIEGGGSVELEERFQAIADEIDGLQGQWSIKIQALGSSGIPVIAGIALSVESPIAGPGTSSLIFMAEKFGFVTENGTTTPFVIVGDQIEFNGNVRINGNLIIDGSGLKQGFEAPGTKNSELDIGIAAGNKIVNSGPYPGSFGPFTLGYNDTGLTPTFNTSPDPYRPAGNGGVYISFDGATPSAGKVCDIYDKHRPVVAGGRCEFSIYMAPHRCDAQVYCAWFKADGSPSTTPYAGFTNVAEHGASGAALAGWPRGVMFATAPNDATSVMLVARMICKGLASPYLFASMWYLGAALPAQTVPSEWSDGAPGSVRDIGYTGALDATYGAPVGTPVGNNLAQDMETLAGAAAKASAAQAAAIATAATAAQAKADLAQVTASAYADGIVTAAEARSIADATAKANAAQAAAVAAAAADATAKANAAVVTAAAAAQAKADLAETEANAYADGIVTAEEARAIADATAKANAAQAAATAAAAADATAKANAAQAAAQAAATLGLAEKLSKSGNEEISGQKSLMSQYAIMVGTVNDGIIYGSTGLYGRKAGLTTFSIGADGFPTFSGALIAATGTFGAVSIAAGGSLGIGATGYNTDAGLWFGWSGGNPKMSVKSAGGKSFLCDPAAEVLSFNGASITGSTINSPIITTGFNAHLAGDGAASGPVNSTIGAYFEVAPTGYTGALSVAWSFTRTGGAMPSVNPYMVVDSDTMGASFVATSTTNGTGTITGMAALRITHSGGLIYEQSMPVSFTFGSGV